MEKISTPSAKAIAITFPRPRTGKNNTLPLKTAPISRLNCLNNSLLVPHKLITNKPLLVSKVLHAENRFIPCIVSAIPASSKASIIIRSCSPNVFWLCCLI
ncbi:hypothetical protein BMETH_163_2 [methanotrophic bacterial endosymbiont of Bathymodiolus sp.]|nr:hypothetical protein BMETH_163_2 [methanotrophic bacterial endosymbiont of Bathymodiolus sp.]